MTAPIHAASFNRTIVQVAMSDAELGEAHRQSAKYDQGPFDRFDKVKNTKAIYWNRKAGRPYSVSLALNERLSHTVAGVCFHAYRLPLRWLIVFSPKGRELLTQALIALAESGATWADDTKLAYHHLLTHPLTVQQRELVKARIFPVFRELLEDIGPGDDDLVESLNKMTRPLRKYASLRQDVQELMVTATKRAA